MIFLLWLEYKCIYEYELSTWNIETRKVYKLEFKFYVFICFIICLISERILNGLQRFWEDGSGSRGLLLKCSWILSQRPDRAAMLANPKTHSECVQQTRWQGMPLKTPKLEEPDHPQLQNPCAIIISSGESNWKSGRPLKIREPQQALKGNSAAIWESGFHQSLPPSQSHTVRQNC